MKVVVSETLERVVEAESIEEVERLYRDCKIVLDSEDFIGVEFSELKEEG